jgi:hypothetical protein
MGDRPVRLGDVIDDYCPRCRLLLNHDIASLMGAEVAKVTCRTCHNTHDYRKGDVPKRKSKRVEKKDLIAEVLQNIPMPPMPPPPPPAPPAEVAAPAGPTQKKRRDLWAELERIKKR